MKWFIVFSAVFGLFIFSVYTATGNTNNDIYRYDEVNQKVYDKHYSPSFWDKVIECGRRFVELGSQSFNTIATFNFQDNTVLATIFGTKIINGLMIPINLIVNSFHWVVDCIDIFVDIPIDDGLRGFFKSVRDGLLGGFIR